ADGGMGPDRRRAAGRGIAAVLPRPCRRDPAARPRHLASLSRGDRAGSEPAADPAPASAGKALCGGLPGGAVLLAAQERRLKRTRSARLDAAGRILAGG